MPEGTGVFLWRGAGHTVPAPLPGNLTDALCAANIIPPLSEGLLSRAGEWAASRVWTLQGRVSLPEADAERLFLCAQGVCGEGDLFINGQPAGRFAPGDWETEITEWADAGESAEICLRFDPRPAGGLPPRACIGVDGGFFVRGANRLTLTDFYACTSITDGYGLVEFRAKALAFVPGRYQLRCAAVFRGEPLAMEETTETLRACSQEIVRRLVVPLPRLWQCGQPNEPVLLRFTVLRAGLVCDDRVVKAGFREISFASDPAMQLCVNGGRVFLKGAVWECGEAFHGEALRERLEILKDCGLNCLRAYGLVDGAMLEWMDENGMLLFCVLPADEARAAQIIRRARGHACLMGYAMESVYVSFNRPADLSHPQVAAIRAVCEELDGARPFFGPIPAGPVARPGRDDLGVKRLVDVLGPDGYPGPEGLCRLGNQDDSPVRTISCPAMCADISALACGEAAWPVTAPLWLHRAKQAPDAGMLREWFGLEPAEMETLAAPLTRLVQAETLRYLAERMRMREAEATGFFVGMPFEAVPSLYSPALFDGLTPRPAFYALESALRSAHVCARLDRMGFYCGTTLEARVDLIYARPTAPGPLTVKAALYDGEGRVLAEETFCAEAKTGPVGWLRAQLPDAPCAMVLRLWLECLGEVLDVSDYMLATGLNALLWPLAHAPYAAVRMQEGALSNTCGRTAFGVCCEGYQDAAWPRWGALFPGESRPVREDAVVTGLNLEPRPTV